MLTHPTLDQLHRLGLAGTARAFTQLDADPRAVELSHAEWLGLLLDREMTERQDRRLKARLRFARLRHQAIIENVDYRPLAASTAPCNYNQSAVAIPTKTHRSWRRGRVGGNFADVLLAAIAIAEAEDQMPGAVDRSIANSSRPPIPTRSSPPSGAGTKR